MSNAHQPSEKQLPLAIDLFCGLGGWTEGLLAEGYYVVGFDIEQHVYGEHRYPAQLVLQDVRTIHGRQFKDAALIVASPPCQAYSWRAMPWKAAKAAPPPDNTLFESCFRIQREASEAAGRHVPMVVENVCGAQKWVGRARWHYGSYYLWGDVPALMPMVRKHAKVGGLDWSKYGQANYKAQGFNTTADQRLRAETGIKQGGTWFHDATSPSRTSSSKSKARKHAAAVIAKIPTPLARHIAAVYHPRAEAA
jgi:C-5 cytosine-specific DNA methylase